MRTRVKMGLVGAVAATALGSMTGVAHADYSTSNCDVASNDPGSTDCWIIFWHDGIAASRGKFEAYDERMVASDYRKDGRGVYVSVRYGDRFYSHWKTGGAGTTDIVDLHIADGTTVTFTSCQTDNGNLLNCTGEKAIA